MTCWLVLINAHFKAGATPGDPIGCPCPGPHVPEAVIGHGLGGTEVGRDNLQVEIGVVYKENARDKECIKENWRALAQTILQIMVAI